jgi:hypothetical protein
MLSVCHGWPVQTTPASLTARRCCQPHASAMPMHDQTHHPHHPFALPPDHQSLQHCCCPAALPSSCQPSVCVLSCRPHPATGLLLYCPGPDFWCLFWCLAQTVFCQRDRWSRAIAAQRVQPAATAQLCKRATGETHEPAPPTQRPAQNNKQQHQQQQQQQQC